MKEKRVPLKKGEKAKNVDKGPTLFDYLNDITFDKKNIFEERFAVKYPTYMILRFLSIREEYCSIADIVNRYSSVWPAEQTHAFLLEVIPRKKCFLNYQTIKGAPPIDKIKDEVRVIADYFQISMYQAYTYYKKCGDTLVKDINKLFGKV